MWQTWIKNKLSGTLLFIINFKNSTYFIIHVIARTQVRTDVPAGNRSWGFFPIRYFIEILTVVNYLNLFLPRVFLAVNEMFTIGYAILEVFSPSSNVHFQLNYTIILFEKFDHAFFSRKNKFYNLSDRENIIKQFLRVLSLLF